MKKYVSLLAVAATAAFALTSCNENDNTPWLLPVVTPNGVYVVNSGHQSGGINGSLTYYDYETGEATTGVYQAANNGNSLGMTANHAVVYGSKIYIVGSGEKTVFVADKNTLKNVANIRMVANGEAVTPRQVVAAYGYVFVSTYNNAVVAIDTLKNAIAQTYKSGDYSEGMTINGPYLYVANSNYGRGKEENSFPSISEINIYTGDTAMYVNEKLNNPVDVKFVNNRMFVLDSGSYDENWNQVGAGVYELVGGQPYFRAAATEMGVDGARLFLINAPYTSEGTEPTYTMFDTANNGLTTFSTGTDIQYPGKISTDPVKGYVYITSYTIGASGYANYKEPGYCVVYDINGNKLGQFNCGVGAGYVVPNFTVDYVQM